MYFDVCVSGLHPEKEKTVVLKYLVNAETFGEAERIALEACEKELSTMVVRSIKRSRITEVMQGDGNGELFYECAVETSDLEGKSFKRLFLVLSNSTHEVEENVRKSDLFDLQSDSISSIISTKYYEVL